MDSPAHWPGASRPLPLPVGRGGRQRTRAPWRHATSLPACVPRHRDASGLLFGAASNPLGPLSLPCSFPLMAEAAMATPMSYTTATSTPPRSLSACLSSALTPWSYPPTHAIRGGRKRPECHRLYLWCPEIAAVNSPAQKPPRARRASLPTPCELPHLPLCSPPPPVSLR